MFEISKFPEIFISQRRIVWDYRQNAKKGDLLFLRKNLSVEQRQLLKENFSELEVLEESNSLNFGKLCSEAFGFPSRKMYCAGITGSNGKSSVAFFCAQLAATQGIKAAVIGTLGVAICEKGQSSTFVDTGFTSPDVPMLQQILQKLLEQKVTHVFLEVSSHALSLGRVDGVDFDAAAMTNLTRDHLDFHKTMDSYKEAKALLFSRCLKDSSKSSKRAFFNADDAFSRELYLRWKKTNIFSIQQFGSRLSFASFEEGREGISLISSKGQRISLPVYGAFQVENIACSFEILSKLPTLNQDALFQGVSELKAVPGRMQRVKTLKGLCFVDYAHTPDALEKALLTLQGLKRSLAFESMSVVFGCGGDRDKGKRPLMGAIAALMADKVIVSSDNPRTEDPNAILAEIVSGVNEGFRFKITLEVDRQKAIRLAVETLGEKELLLIAGKGHEAYQIIGKEKFPFDDVKVVEASEKT